MTKYKTLELIRDILLLTYLEHTEATRDLKLRLLETIDTQMIASAGMEDDSND